MTQKNIEEDKRQLKNDMDVKDFQLRQINEERDSMTKKIEEMNKEMHNL